LYLKDKNPSGTRKKSVNAPLLIKNRQIPAPTRAGIIFFPVLTEGNGKSVGDKGKKSYGPGPFYRQRKGPLMLGAGPGNAPREYLPAFGDKAAQRVGVLVINFQLLNTEFADFLLEENFAFTAPAVFSVPSVHLGIGSPVLPGRTFVIFHIFFVRHINS